MYTEGSQLYTSANHGGNSNLILLFAMPRMSSHTLLIANSDDRMDEWYGDAFGCSISDSESIEVRLLCFKVGVHACTRDRNHYELNLTGKLFILMIGKEQFQ